ncbi:MAG: CAP domain-containing protein [Chloroflexi bacterium]|nr:CAP domain-containing protein [Chloroflexota bacterium]
MLRKRTFLIVLAACILGVSQNLCMVQQAGATGPDSVSPQASLQQQMLSAINQARLTNGNLPPLTLDSRLTGGAQAHSDWMVSHNCFAHNCPGEVAWPTRDTNAGYPSGRATSENIAAASQFHAYSNPAAVVDAWMNGPGEVVNCGTSWSHRCAILDPRAVGVGVGIATPGQGVSATYYWYWTADFGTVSNGAQSPTPTATPILPNLNCLDINLDHQVNGSDMRMLAGIWHTLAGFSFDVITRGRVSVRDLQLLGMQMGRSC